MCLYAKILLFMAVRHQINCQSGFQDCFSGRELKQFCQRENAILNMPPWQTMPANKMINEIVLFSDTLLNLKSKYPMTILSDPHSTLLNGDELPKPGGLPKGEGNGLPEMPLT